MRYPHLYIGARPPFVETKAKARGAFVVTTRPLASRRAHLVSDAVAIWHRGVLDRIGATTKCGRALTSAVVLKEVPDRIELCDDCALADYAPVVVYRIFDADSRLLYVGCTKNLATRLRAHVGLTKSPSPWWPLVDRWTLEEFDTIEEGLAAEARAIVAERPIFNIDLTDRAKHPRRRRSANLHLIHAEVAA